MDDVEYINYVPAKSESSKFLSEITFDSKIVSKFVIFDEGINKENSNSL